MSNKLTIAVSGKANSGKKTLIKFIVAEFLNRKIGNNRFAIEKHGKDVFIIDTLNNFQSLNPLLKTDKTLKMLSAYSCKIYDFLDPVKKICIDSYGLDYEQCYGTEESQSTDTHILWDNMPHEIRIKYGKKRKGSRVVKPVSGKMTAEKFTQIFDKEICRKIDNNCWARSLYNIINEEGFDLAILTGVTCPNEVTTCVENNNKVIRLLRNVDDLSEDNDNQLDLLPLGEYSLVLHNEDFTPEKLWRTAYPIIINWFKLYNII
jgi:hypothetical protein